MTSYRAMVFVFLIVSLSPLIVKTQLPPWATPCYQFLCRCQDKIADCNNQGNDLTFIPKLETKDPIQLFFFSHNNLSNIVNDTFDNILHFNITYLQLRYDDITHIDQDAFAPLKNLITLDLSHNPIHLPDLDLSLPCMPTTLSYMYLEGLHITDETLDDLLVNLHKNIVGLHLADNELTNFNFNSLSNFSSLATLSLERNNITDVFVSEDVHTSLATLWLNHNNISTIPDFCHNTKKSTPALPRLYTLSLEFNNLQILTELNFRCLQNVHHLFLSGNPIMEIRHLSFHNMRRLEFLNISNNAANLSIESQAFVGKTYNLQTLNISNSMITYLSVDSLNMYNCSLKTIDLNGNPGIGLLGSDRFKLLLQRCNSLEVLLCDNCNLTSIPDVITVLPKLVTLSLNDNSIKTIPDRMFDNNHELRILYLGRNRIKSIGDSTISNSVRTALTNASLEDNPFVCSCNILWLRNWLIQARPLFSTRLSHYKCAYPGAKNKERIVDDPEITNGACYKYNHMLFTVLFSVAMTLLCIVCFALGYKFRWYFRYRVKRKKGLSSIDERQPLLTNDVYIMYCDEDYSWVRYKALPMLEEMGRLSVCFRQRDFNPMEHRVDSAIYNVRNCKHVLFVLSNTFFKDKESLFELTLIREHLKDDHEILVVALEDVDDRYMTQDLYRLLKNREHLRWTGEDDGVVWQRLLSQIRGDGYGLI